MNFSMSPKMDPSSVRYTAFIVSNGQFKFLRVPFGLYNSPSVFQRYVNAIRAGKVLTYMDDLIILSYNYEDGLARLKTRLRLRIRPVWRSAGKSVVFWRGAWNVT